MLPEIAENVQQTLAETVDDAERVVRTTARSVRAFASEMPYAMIGGIDLAVRGAMSLPGVALDAVLAAPERAREGIDDLCDRGHHVVEKVLGDPGVHGARGAKARRAKKHATRAPRAARGRSRRAARGSGTGRRTSHG